MVNLTDCLDIHIAVDWDVTPQTEQKKDGLKFLPGRLVCHHSIILILQLLKFMRDILFTHPQSILPHVRIL